MKSNNLQKRRAILLCLLFMLVAIFASNNSLRAQPRVAWFEVSREGWSNPIPIDVKNDKQHGKLFFNPSNNIGFQLIDLAKDPAGSQKVDCSALFDVTLILVDNSRKIVIEETEILEKNRIGVGDYFCEIHFEWLVKAGDSEDYLYDPNTAGESFELTNGQQITIEVYLRQPTETGDLIPSNPSETESSESTRGADTSRSPDAGAGTEKFDSQKGFGLPDDDYTIMKYEFFPKRFGAQLLVDLTKDGFERYLTPVTNIQVPIGYVIDLDGKQDKLKGFGFLPVISFHIQPQSKWRFANHLTFGAAVPISLENNSPSARFGFAVGVLVNEFNRSAIQIGWFGDTVNQPDGSSRRADFALVGLDLTTLYDVIKENFVVLPDSWSVQQTKEK